MVTCTSLIGVPRTNGCRSLEDVILVRLVNEYLIILRTGASKLLTIDENVFSCHCHTEFDILRILPQITWKYPPEQPSRASHVAWNCLLLCVQVPTRCLSAKLTFEARLFACSDWMGEILPLEITANPLRTNNTLTRPILFLALHTPHPPPSVFHFPSS